MCNIKIYIILEVYLITNQKNNNMTTYKINGGKNSKYIISRTENMLPNSAKAAIQNDKEPVIYFMQGITRTGKKSKEMLMCYRFNSGNFIKVF